jgi:hypothetical protein
VQDESDLELNESTLKFDDACNEEKFIRNFRYLPAFTKIAKDVTLVGGEDKISGWNFSDAAGNVFSGVHVLNDAILDVNGKVLGQIVDGAVKLNDGIVMSAANAGATIIDATGEASAEIIDATGEATSAVIDATGDAVEKVNNSLFSGLSKILMPVCVVGGIIGGGFLIFKIAGKGQSDQENS